jgi:hypothetical protein
MSNLERATHICLISVSVVSLALLMERRFAPKVDPRPSAQELVGKHLDVPGLNWKSSHLNAVFYISARCHFCRDSMPFYRQVSERQNGNRQRVALSVLSPEGPEELKKLLAKENIAVDGFYRTPRNVSFRGTPTLLLVDDRGIVLRAFEGKLDQSREREFLRIIEDGTVGGPQASVR